MTICASKLLILIKKKTLKNSDDSRHCHSLNLQNTYNDFLGLNMLFLAKNMAEKNP